MKRDTDRDESNITDGLERLSVIPPVNSNQLVYATVGVTTCIWGTKDVSRGNHDVVNLQLTQAHETGQTSSYFQYVTNEYSMYKEWN
jgi:hypothetical protein